MRPQRAWFVPYAFAAIPALALSLAIPFVNRPEPAMFGAPFLLVWIVGWVLAAPLFLYAAYRTRQRA